MPSINRLCSKLVFVVVLAASACAPSIAPFSQQAYTYATELKVDTLKLMDRAETRFSENADRIEKVETKLEKAFEFARGRPRNSHSSRQWELLLNPDRNLVGGFLKKWEDQGSLSYAFIQESRLLVSDAFDSIIGLESGKLRYTGRE